MYQPLIESLAKYYPKAQWQCCMVHFYRNVFSVVPKGKVKHVAATILRLTSATVDKGVLLMICPGLGFSMSR